MSSIGGIGAVIVIAAALALALAAAWLAARASRRGASRETELLAELTRAVEGLRDSVRGDRDARDRAERVADEAREDAVRLRSLLEVASPPDLDGVLRRALAAARATSGAHAAVIVLADDGGHRSVVTSGLPEGAPIGLPSGSVPARATTIEYRYAAGEPSRDVPRLHGGVAVPLERPDVGPIGQLAVFWRSERQAPVERTLAALEDLATVLGPALDRALRLEDARRAAEVDPGTALLNRHGFRTRLVAECGRARRYDRRLALVLLSFSGTELETTAGQLGRALRVGDLGAHLGDGLFAVLMPEASSVDAQPLLRRLRFVFGVVEPSALPASVAELRPEEDPASFLARAESELGRGDAGLRQNAI